MGRSRDGSTDVCITIRLGMRWQWPPDHAGRGKSAAQGFTPEEAVALAAWHSRLGLDTGDDRSPPGDGTPDVFVNDSMYWSNIPAAIWSCAIGGYQLIKKWFSYRELEVLGRPLPIDEIGDV